MEEKQINPTESFAIINAMINTSKNKLADDGFLFIFWGWIIFIAALVNYACMVSGYTNGHMIWAIVTPAGAVVSVIYGMKQRRKTAVRTHLDRYLGFVWGGFLIVLFITLFSMHWHGMKTTYFFLMLIYGIATFISGGILNFRPLVTGSLFSFFFSVVSLFVGVQEQFLCLAGALLFSYIVPGHLLRRKYRTIR